MQTFMPLGTYYDSARVLDVKRLGKQRVEAYQILKALSGDYDQSNAWVNHPATVMWRNNPYELALYGLTISVEFFERGYDGSNMMDIFTDYMVKLVDYTTNQYYPWWVAHPDFMLSHQSNLVRKDPQYYREHFPQVPDNIPYLWPLPDHHAFRLGSYKNGDNLKMYNNGIVYMTSTQVAEYLGVSPKTISAYKARGQMPEPDRTYGRTPLWRLDTINKWRDSGEAHFTITKP